jgi:hypothetical protein
MSESVNANFDTDFILEEAEAPQLGIKASDKINRRLVTQEKIGSSSFIAVLDRVQYGTYNGTPTCLVALDFTFRFGPKAVSRYNEAHIKVSFTRAADANNHKTRNEDPDLDPKVQNMAPKSVYGIVKTVEEKTVKDFTVPVMFESPLGLSAGVELHAGMERTEHQESRMEIHGQLFEDDDHVDGANAVFWDLYENRAQ